MFRPKIREARHPYFLAEQGGAGGTSSEWLKLRPRKTPQALKVSAETCRRENCYRMRTNASKTCRRSAAVGHGIGLIVTIKIFLQRDPWPQKGVSLETAVNKAIESSSEYRFDLSWTAGGSAQGTLDVISRALRKHVRERVLGPDCPEGSGEVRPFSVAAIVSGAFDRPDEGLTQGPDWQHAMQALCNLRKPWQKANLYPLKDALLRIRRSVPSGHGLYHSDRGRALWFPANFSDQEKPRNRSAGCYQRNLTLLHLQLSSMIEALRSQADLVAGGEAVPPMLDTLAASAAQQLSALYGSTSGTYRSSSPRACIDEHADVKALVENALGRKLSYTETLT